MYPIRNLSIHIHLQELCDHGQRIGQKLAIINSDKLLIFNSFHHFVSLLMLISSKLITSKFICCFLIKNYLCLIRNLAMDIHL